MTDLLSAALCTAIVVVSRVAIGWRPGAGVGSILAGFAVALPFAYALASDLAFLGIGSKEPEPSPGAWLIILLPLAIVSDATVPTAGMPGWLQSIASWSPVGAVTAAVRHLLHSPNRSASISAWPMEHPLVAALAWSAAILVVCAPLAAHLFRPRTLR